MNFYFLGLHAPGCMGSCLGLSTIWNSLPGHWRTDRVRDESRVGGRPCLWRSQGYLGLVSWTRGRVGWRHVFQLAGVAQAKAEENRVRTSYQCPHVLISEHCAILLMLWAPVDCIPCRWVLSLSWQDLEPQPFSAVSCVSSHNWPMKDRTIWM